MLWLGVYADLTSVLAPVGAGVLALLAGLATNLAGITT
jgi:hypothetical protein